jgi:hypothetical protein
MQIRAVLLLPAVGDIWVPFVLHVDFLGEQTGGPVPASERRKTVRDRYVVTVPDPRRDSASPSPSTPCEAADPAATLIWPLLARITAV